MEYSSLSISERFGPLLAFHVCWAGELLSASNELLQGDLVRCGVHLCHLVRLSHLHPRQDISQHDIHLLIGHVAFAMGDRERALRHWDMAVDLAPSSPVAPLHVVYARIARGEYTNTDLFQPYLTYSSNLATHEPKTLSVSATLMLTIVAALCPGSRLNMNELAYFSFQLLFQLPPTSL